VSRFDDDNPVVYDLPPVIVRRARRTGKLPERSQIVKPYKAPLERQRERYWSGPIVREEGRSLLSWLLILATICLLLVILLYIAFPSF
jgi:hypothetical protein